MPVFFFIQCDLDVHASRSFFCPADSPASPLDHGRCKAPAPSGKFSLLSQIQIFHRFVVEESKCDSGLDKVFFCLADSPASPLDHGRCKASFLSCGQPSVAAGPRQVQGFFFLSCGQPSVADSFLSCRQPSVAAGPRQVQCTCTLRKILFAYANSNFPSFGMRGEAQSHSEPYMVIFL